LGTDQRGVGLADGFFDFDEPGHDFGGMHWGTFSDLETVGVWCRGWGGGVCDRAHRGGAILAGSCSIKG
jgi:hypothetical protein